MSIIPPVAPDAPDEKRRVSHWLLASLVVGLVALILLSWFLWARLQRTQDQLQSVLQRLEMVARKQESLDKDLRQSHEQTQTAREQAQASEERATKSELAQAQAAKDAEQAQAAKMLSDQQAAACPTTSPECTRGTGPDPKGPRRGAESYAGGPFQSGRYPADR